MGYLPNAAASLAAADVSGISGPMFAVGRLVIAKGF